MVNTGGVNWNGTINILFISGSVSQLKNDNSGDVTHVCFTVFKVIRVSQIVMARQTRDLKFPGVYNTSRIVWTGVHEDGNQSLSRF